MEFLTAGSQLSLNYEFVNIVQQNTSVCLYFLVSNHDCSLNEEPRASSLACPSLTSKQMHSLGQSANTWSSLVTLLAYRYC